MVLGVSHVPTVSPEDFAREFAVRAHGDQRYGDAPYVTHLEAVRAVLRDFGYGHEFGVLAWLHDVLEDTKVSYESLLTVFGKDVACAVWVVTGEGGTRSARVASALGKLRARPEYVPLKLADRIANVEASAKDNPRLLAMYRSEHEDFFDALGQYGDPRMWTRLSLAYGKES